MSFAIWMIVSIFVGVPAGLWVSNKFTGDSAPMFLGFSPRKLLEMEPSKMTKKLRQLRDGAINSRAQILIDKLPEYFESTIIPDIQKTAEARRSEYAILAFGVVRNLGDPLLDNPDGPWTKQELELISQIADNIEPLLKSHGLVYSRKPKYQFKQWQVLALVVRW